MQRSGRDEVSQTYATVKEICGIEDHHVIDEAINACRTKDGSFRVEDVVSMLIQDETVRRRQKVPTDTNKVCVWFTLERACGAVVVRSSPPVVAPLSPMGLGF